jgi:RNA-directed DNA polymerase
MKKEHEKSAEVVVLESVFFSRGRTESRKLRSSMDSFERWKVPESRNKIQGHGATGSKAELESGAHEEGQRTSSAWDKERALTMQLMEKVCERTNLNQAYRRVKSNKGAAGVDGMTIDELAPWIHAHKEELKQSLLDGSYEPQSVRGVEIPKAAGGIRQLGIPTVVDRLVQQAILQVISPILDPTFSTSSYGFRPTRGAHQALKAATKFVEEGRRIVVDLDLEKFFDRVNHDILMSRLARRIGDKRLLKIIRRFLTAGIMRQGVCVRRVEGTPQGGPLSPLLANVLLDDLDKELEKRGHTFCRYADDCNIYVRSLQAGQRVMDSICQFIEKKLKLRVNRDKSAVAFIEERKFLGYRLLRGGKLGIAPKSLRAAKDKIKKLTRRNRGRKLEAVVYELNQYLGGWVIYYRHAKMSDALGALEKWVRRKLRCYRLKQRKRSKSIADHLISLGVPPERAWPTAVSSKGWWTLSNSPAVKEAMDTDWFGQMGLINLSKRYAELQAS